MIELGAGFDMDLTARENIFLNGAVLGHDRDYMMEHFDRIIEIFGAERFCGCSGQKLFQRHDRSFGLFHCH